MYLDRLTLTQFRNYNRETLTFSRGVNVLVGENAQGKTNVIEGIHCLALGKSHRTNRDADLVQWNTDVASISAHVTYEQYAMRELRIDYRNGAKQARINGVPQSKMTDYVGCFQTVLFAPEDLQLVKGGPAVRRRFIDMELGQTQVKYLYHLSRYSRALQQRNALLRTSNVLDDSFLAAFDEQLVEHGSEILLRRRHFIGEMRVFSKRIHCVISEDKESLELRYACSVRGIEDDVDMTLEDIQLVLRESLIRKHGNDIHLGYTSVGPHRDDLLFLLNGQSVQSFASQGQQRTIALSVRLAEIDFIHKEVGEYPVLLLDDVLSELDDGRQRNLVLSMSEKVQTILTTTSLYHLESELSATARLFHVQSGIIQSEG